MRQYAFGRTGFDEYPFVFAVSPLMCMDGKVPCMHLGIQESTDIDAGLRPRVTAGVKQSEYCT